MIFFGETANRPLTLRRVSLGVTRSGCHSPIGLADSDRESRHWPLAFPVSVRSDARLVPEQSPRRRASGTRFCPCGRLRRNGAFPLRHPLCQQSLRKVTPTLGGTRYHCRPLQTLLDAANRIFTTLPVVPVEAMTSQE